ncbi:D-3-phosphoglycerate dehydrogenase [Franzmannia pantelleriensis]|uniref:D-3-phosphoglycerate dehydrogenase n=1 Tax=Franzmannia pantelleriensis TaxID=48727 RepID=A0A1G9GBH5_9GAMM|nr:hydroxyacid dehydrogenase [Halomonas pantelleriensis]SDK98016.1 D-3-phosphoglycerate dehydrogenase [Halomonas pantelleriensis]
MNGGLKLLADKTILVTGPNLAEQACTIADEAGYKIVCSPPYPDENTLLSYIERHDPVAIISRMGKITDAALKSGKSLKVISKHGAGVDNIDVNAATRRGVKVMRAPGANAVSVAEHTLALMLATIKRLIPLDASMRNGHWEKASFLGREVAGMRLGLIGGGAIAVETLKMAKGLGLKVSVYDPFVSEEYICSLGAACVKDLDALFRCSDVISLHCPHTNESHHILDSRTIGLMPRGSYVINTSRGGLIDEEALAVALDNDHIAGAGLDTFEDEPPKDITSLMRSEKVVLSPHVAGVTEEAGSRVGVLAVSGVVDYLDGKHIEDDRMVN